MTPKDDENAQKATSTDRTRVYSRKAFAALIGRSVSTLRSWEQKGLLVAFRYPSNRPFYTEAQLQQVLRQTTE